MLNQAILRHFNSELERNKNAIESFLINSGFEKSEINMTPMSIYQDTYRDALLDIMQELKYLYIQKSRFG